MVFLSFFFFGPPPPPPPLLRLHPLPGILNPKSAIADRKTFAVNCPSRSRSTFFSAVSAPAIE